MKSKPTKTTAANLETRFDAGEDVSDYFDFARPVVWGGARRGAGRRQSGKVRKQVMLSSRVAEKSGASPPAANKLSPPPSKPPAPRCVEACLARWRVSQL